MRPSRSATAVSGYGVGVVWWPELDPLCRPGEGLVHVIEAEPETFWIPHAGHPPRFTSRLHRAIAHLPQPKLLHGVGAPFGGGPGQLAQHRKTLAGDISAVQPGWISDHLSFNRFVPSPIRGEAIGTGFLLPPAQCRKGIDQAAEQIRQRRSTAGVPVAFENPVSYLPPRPGEMPDGEFAAEVAEAADCGILLDLHNLLCNERNGRQTVREFCRSIPLERVWEIHLAGGQSERGFWLDAHSGLVEPVLMEMVAELVPRLPALGAIIFEIKADSVASTGLAAIGTLLGQLQGVWASRGNAARSVGRATGGNTWMTDAVTPDLWERAIGAAVTGSAAPDLPQGLADWVRSAETRLELYRYLAQEGRASSLVFTAPRTIRSLLVSLGEAETRRLLGQFWRQAPPAYTAVEEADAFLDFLCGAGVAGAVEAEIAGDRDLLRQVRQ